MPSVRRSRTLAASPEQVWRVLSDPHHLPRWWPRVERVEAVEGEEFTELLRTRKGKAVRADFRLLHREDGRRLIWGQLIDGTPFARVLSSAETEIELAPAGPEPGERAGAASTAAGAHEAGTPGANGPATEVSIELRQVLRGVFPNRTLSVPWLGSWLVRKAARKTVEEALDGLERIVG
jgi:uncharacterized protein YndB with AHSA1/START domain